MVDKRRRLSWFRSITLASLALVTAGCSEELGPERMVVTRVKGLVRTGRSPVKRGWIEFVPVEGTVGKLCSAKIHDDGSFDAAHVPVGINLIRLPNASLGSVAADQLFGSYHSPIRRVIPARPTDPIVVDIFEETIRYKTHAPGGGDSEPRESGATR
jgi:hypothetical protein